MAIITVGNTLPDINNIAVGNESHQICNLTSLEMQIQV